MPIRPLALFLSLALAACTAAQTEDPPAPAADTDAELPPIPFCRDQMTAYVELVRLARAQGEGWIVFAPALDALKQQILDCVGDSAAQFHELRLSPNRPLLPPPGPQPCGAGCASARSAGWQRA
jgi:hypothetical protein